MGVKTLEAAHVRYSIVSAGVFKLFVSLLDDVLVKIGPGSSGTDVKVFVDIHEFLQSCIPFSESVDIDVFGLERLTGTFNHLFENVDLVLLSFDLQFQVLYRRLCELPNFDLSLHELFLCFRVTLGHSSYNPILFVIFIIFEPESFLHGLHSLRCHRNILALLLNEELEVIFVAKYLLHVLFYLGCLFFILIVAILILLHIFIHFPHFGPVFSDSVLGFINRLLLSLNLLLSLLKLDISLTQALILLVKLLIEVSLVLLILISKFLDFKLHFVNFLGLSVSACLILFKFGLKTLDFFCQTKHTGLLLQKLLILFGYLI